MLQVPISMETAISLCCEQVKRTGSEYISVEEAWGRVNYNDIRAKADVPAYASSAVDGYTVCAEDIQKLAEGNQALLKVTAKVGAGQIGLVEMSPGHTINVMTGAMLPENAVAVCKREDVTRSGTSIMVPRPIKPGENVHLPGNEIKAGELVAEKGQELTPEVLEGIASCGMAEIEVYSRPLVYIMNTGTELILPGRSLKKGQVYASNRSLLAAKINAAGGIPVLPAKEIPDNLEGIITEIKSGLDFCNMLIISGGTGEGDYDLIVAALNTIEADLLFKGIDISPGRTAAAAVYENKLIFSLTGNPRGLNILSDVLLRPVFNQMRGLRRQQEKWLELPLNQPLKKIAKRRSLKRAELVIENGQAMARPLPKNIRSTEGNALILDLQPGQGKSGDIVRGLIL